VRFKKSILDTLMTLRVLRSAEVVYFFCTTFPKGTEKTRPNVDRLSERKKEPRFLLVLKDAIETIVVISAPTRIFVPQ
tara:strand:- start:22 stop:255 length:234 start_codon:yes stop_codon:yes gene_type:complete